MESRSKAMPAREGKEILWDQQQHTPPSTSKGLALRFHYKALWAA